jgi:hypothetical protein
MRDEHHLFEVSPRGISDLAWIGNCEVLVSSSHARPVASIVGKGIYVLEGSAWKKLFEWPLAKTESDHDASLAESDGRVAYLTAKAPNIVRIDPGSNHAEWTDTGTDGLWISKDGRLIPLYLDGRWFPPTSSDGN